MGGDTLKPPAGYLLKPQRPLRGYFFPCSQNAATVESLVGDVNWLRDC